jgi:hypothetical protein
MIGSVIGDIFGSTYEFLGIKSEDFLLGDKIVGVTQPLELTGPKARRLLLYADATVRPAWGSWSRIDRLESAGRAFRELRAAINKAIAPHEIDHIDFTTDPSAQNSSR